MTDLHFNSYASTILENHPLVVWPLDDDLYYLSAFGIEDESESSNRRYFHNWDTIGCSILEIPGNESYPYGLASDFKPTGKLIPDFGISKCSLGLQGVARWSKYYNKGDEWTDLLYINNPATGDWTQILNNAESIEIVKDALRKSLNISFLVSYDENILTTLSSFEFTIKYKVEKTFKTQLVECFIPETTDNWKKISATIDMTEIIGGFELLISAKFTEPVANHYEILMAGLNIGYWSEIYCHQYNGLSPVAIPSNISNIIGGEECVYISSLLDDTNNGIVLVDNGRLLALNDGIPLVYGSTNQTCLYYPIDSNRPSIVLPSNGFLTQSGKYNDATFEFWMRLDNKKQTPFKIFGTLDADDGLYVERGFLMLKIGSKYASHYVGKWYRPMLISIRYSSTKVSLLINGEQVISLSLDDSDIDSFSDNEFLGFFCNQETFPFEIDCIVLYPYYQSIETAKKNFIYGQGVQKTNIIDQSYKGETIHFDFSFSKYDVDFRYPDSIKWNSGIFTNVFVNDTSISVPSYDLPEINIKNVDPTKDATTVSAWSSSLASTLASGADYIHFNLLPSNQYGYIYYSTIEQLNEIVKTIFVDTKIFGTGPLLTLRDKNTKSYLTLNIKSITGSNALLEIKFSNYGDSEQLLYSQNISISSRQKIGLNIEKFMSFYSSRLSGFLNSPKYIEMFIGGFNNQSLNAHIFSVNFNGSEYSSLLNSQSNGLYVSTASIGMSNNQLCFFKQNGYMEMDLNISGYWRNYMPLSFFAKYIKDNSGQKFYDIDMMQLNIDSVIPPVNQYENADIKSYITFQKNTISPKSINDYQSTVYIDKVLNLNNLDWENQKYYFTDETVIYPPKNEYINNLLVGIHIKFDVKKSTYKSTVVKRCELTSVCFDNNSLYSIGTKFGSNVYAIARYGNAIVSKTFNPFLITKDSSSYLYLTKNSGITLLDVNTDYERGIYIPINENAVKDFKLGAIRLWLRYNNENFSTERKKLFEISIKNKTYFGYLTKDFDNDRAFIKLIDSLTNEEVKNIKYIQEDIEVSKCVLTSQRWSSISIMFADSIDLNEYAGSLILFPGATYQNIAFYENSNESVYNVIQSDQWLDIKDYNNNSLPDDEWNDIDNLKWYQVLNRKLTQTYFIDTIPIYRSLIGTQSEKINDTKPINTKYKSSVNLYKDVTLSSYVLKKGEIYNVP